jgi:hypothetical protein
LAATAICPVVISAILVETGIRTEQAGEKSQSGSTVEKLRQERQEPARTPALSQHIHQPSAVRQDPGRIPFWMHVAKSVASPIRGNERREIAGSKTVTATTRKGKKVKMNWYSFSKEIV